NRMKARVGLAAAALSAGAFDATIAAVREARPLVDDIDGAGAPRADDVGVAVSETSLLHGYVYAPDRYRALLAGLEARRGSAVIAEIKIGSPSLGSLVGTFDPVERAKAYKRGGAACLSVVVEPEFFFGDYQILTRCVEATGLPAIAKDFVVDPLQLKWASRAGAKAVLLIAALYSAAELREYAEQARKLELVPLVETHDADDIAKLEGGRWELVGINNRNLRTFTVDLDTSRGLQPTLPADAFKVAESGIKTAEDVNSLRDAGFDAYLIGETLVKSGEPQATLEGLLGGGAGAS
ncbi:MAG: indole-3-glycerol-phosphate synthase, partial [Acidobacteriota bacterium]